MLKYVIFLFLLIFLVSFETLGDASSHKECLIKILKSIKKENTHMPLNKIKARIAKIFEDDSLSPRKKAKKAFKVFTQARIKLLPTHLQDEARDILKKGLKIIDDQKKFDGSSAWAPGRISRINLVSEGIINISRPIEMRKSVVEYAARVHEFEETIFEMELHDRAGYSWLYQKIVGEIPIIRGIKHIEAIKSEWKFLNAIPRSKKLEILEELKKNTQFSSLSGASLIESMLTDTDVSFKAYQKIQSVNLKGGRKVKLEDYNLEGNGDTLFSTAGGIFVGGTIVNYFFKVCQDKKFIKSTPQFSNEICKIFKR